MRNSNKKESLNICNSSGIAERKSLRNPWKKKQEEFLKEPQRKSPGRNTRNSDGIPGEFLFEICEKIQGGTNFCSKKLKVFPKQILKNQRDFSEKKTV